MRQHCKVRSSWPFACHARLLELYERIPALTNKQIGQMISAMPEARAHGLIATKSAVCGKIWRMRKWSPETAAKLKRSTQS